MSYLEKLKKFEEGQKEEKSEPRVVDIPLLTLTGFSKRNMALEVFSEVLNENIWICSDEGMVAQITRDNPEAVCYTAREMIELVKVKPTPENIKAVYEAKSIFPKSRVVEGKLREDND